MVLVLAQDRRVVPMANVNLQEVMEILLGKGISAAKKNAMFTNKQMIKTVGSFPRKIVIAKEG